MFELIWSNLLSTLFPERCVVCLKNETGLCDECVTKLPPARNTPANTIVLFLYQDPAVKRVIWALKYRNRNTVSGIVGKLLHEAYLAEQYHLEALSDFVDPIVIPIPTSRGRSLARGYNQAARLARAFAASAKLGVLENTLVKIRDTIPQSTIKNRDERIRNLIGSFSVAAPEKVRRKNIILVDDVLTTGATMENASKALRDAGAREILKIVAAH